MFYYRKLFWKRVKLERVLFSNIQSDIHSFYHTGCISYFSWPLSLTAYVQTLALTVVLSKLPHLQNGMITVQTLQVRAHEDKQTSMRRQGRCINQLELTAPLKNTPPNSSRLYVLFKCKWNIQKDLILSHNTNLNKFKRIKIIQSMFSDSNKVKLEIKNRSIWKIINYFWILKKS